jgi:hypothetical protein
MSYSTTPRDFRDKDAAYTDLARDLTTLIGAERDPLVERLVPASTALRDARPE